MTFKIGAKSSAANLLQVAESFDRFFEDPGLVVMTTNVLFTVNTMFYFLTRAIKGLLFPNVLLPFLCISHPISSCEMLENPMVTA